MLCGPGVCSFSFLKKNIFCELEIEREIRTKEEATTLKTYKYEEYYTQSSHKGIKIGKNNRVNNFER